ncbi:STAS domain-containing protein [Sporosarcina sp. BI001-red]|uniref:STAS domain-containing protein n=1 Tax=Sporosarcina sp. BI001-red TaxID=2282866 RepID=UPI000E22455E|nr:STAS domain-containing protein [Sporosarcina sp. BI001-red]REB05274.1 STAS domain-containing protein [Sporosarcina sp. BI001-red]
MMDWNKELNIYLMDTINTITDEWLALRDSGKKSIYSSDAGALTEQTLRDQNNMTNRTIASSLLGPSGEFEEQKAEWAELIAKSRIASNTSISEVVDAISRVRKVFWRQIERFVGQQTETVPVTVVLQWGETIHLAFDELLIAFSDMYFTLMTTRLSAQQSLIAELSSPIIKINENIGILPLVGDIDTDRAKAILEVIPAKCMEADIINLFIDLSGVSIIDTMVANQIYEVVQVLNLLGVKSTITGIRPEIAQTSIQLGLDFSTIETHSSLEQALKDRYIVKKVD